VDCSLTLSDYKLTEFILHLLHRHQFIKVYVCKLLFIGIDKHSRKWSNVFMDANFDFAQM